MLELKNISFTAENEDGENDPGEIFNVYNKVNNAIGNLQTSLIVNHQFLIGERLATEAEKQADAQAVADAWVSLPTCRICWAAVASPKRWRIL